MSWINDIENTDFQITTGDSKVFTPLWRPEGESFDFNVNAFESINLEGTKIDRKKAKSSKHPITFYFQGETHVEKVREFKVSSKDSRQWIITHPFLGRITGHPLSISFDYSQLNTSIVKVDFWESIGVTTPKAEVNLIESITTRAQKIDDSTTEYFAMAAKPDTKDISVLRKKNFRLGVAIANIKSNINQLVDKASNSINSIVEKPALFATAIKEVISLPKNILKTVKQKIRFAENILDQLKDDLKTKSDKVFYESKGAALIADLTNEIVTNTEFTTRTEVQQAVESILDIYDSYVETLDENEVSIYDTENFFGSNTDIQQELSDLINLSVKSLFKISLSAKQERKHDLEKNSNLVLLTHRFLGLDINDENIEKFREINNIKNDEVFMIPKGREIIYYV